MAMDFGLEDNKYFKDGGTIGELPKECIDGIVAGQLAYLKSPEYKKKKEFEKAKIMEKHNKSIMENKRLEDYKAKIMDFKDTDFKRYVSILEDEFNESLQRDALIPEKYRNIYIDMSILITQCLNYLDTKELPKEVRVEEIEKNLIMLGFFTDKIKNIANE